MVGSLASALLILSFSAYLSKQLVSFYSQYRKRWQFVLLPTFFLNVSKIYK